MTLSIKKSKRKVCVSKLGLLYIITMVVAEVHQAGLYGGYYLTPFIISLFWFGLAILKYYNRNQLWKKPIGKDALYAVWIFIFPWVVFILYNIIVFATCVGHRPFLKSSFVQIMFTPCILLGAYGMYIIFDKKTLRYLLYSIFIHYFILISVQFIRMGSSDFFNGILTVFTGMSIGNPFETNSDMVLALGLLSLYYLDSFVRKRTRENTHYILVLIMVLLGGKRIELLAIAVIFAANISMFLIKDKNKNIMQAVISLLFLIALYVFVFAVISGLFTSFAVSHGINTMGRIKMWDYVAQFTAFSPDYLGKGYQFSNLILELDRVHVYNGHTYVLHSDILKVYFDMGFIMFSFWGIYNLFIIPSLFRKKYGYRIGNFCWSLIIFLFVLYITDNAINYFITQSVLLILIMHSIGLKKLNMQEVRCR